MMPAYIKYINIIIQSLMINIVNSSHFKPWRWYHFVIYDITCTHSNIALDKLWIEYYAESETCIITIRKYMLLEFILYCCSIRISKRHCFFYIILWLWSNERIQITDSCNITLNYLASSPRTTNTTLIRHHPEQPTQH